MPTDGKCGRCGYRAPVSSFIGAAGNGELLPDYIKLPQVVQGPFYMYLSLFRPTSGCACSDPKIIRLTREMVALVSVGYVSQQGKADRPCPPSLWAMGMERMMEQSATLTLPMKNHNYLRAIVYQLADQADSKQERQVRQAEQTGATKIRRPSDDDMSPEMRRYIAEHGEPVVSPEAQGALQGILQKFKDRQGAFDAE